MKILKFLLTLTLLFGLTTSAYADFTPPTAEYSPDAYDVLLMHLNGDDQSVTMPDSSTTNNKGNATVADNAQLDTAQKQFGTASLLLDGTGDYISYADSDDWNFGAGNWTIDFWFGAPSDAKQGFFGQYVDTNNYTEFYYLSADDKLYFFSRSGGTYIAQYSKSWTYSNDTWYHIALVRNGTTMYLFIGGVSQALSITTAISTNALPDLASSFYTGYCQSITVGYLNGWIDEYRISKGIARDWITDTGDVMIIHITKNFINNLNPDKVGTPMWSCKIKAKTLWKNLMWKYRG